jgi:hypothetical protein
MPRPGQQSAACAVKPHTGRGLAVTGQGQQLPTGHRIPEYHEPIRPRGGQPLSVRVEGPGLTARSLKIMPFVRHTYEP